MTHPERAGLLDTLRKAARRPAHLSLHDIEDLWRSLSELRASKNQEPPDALEAELHRAAVLNILQSLPHRYAQVRGAKYGDGLSVEQIAAMMGVNNTTVQSLLARAREAFKSKWLATMDPEKEVSSP